MSFLSNVNTIRTTFYANFPTLEPNVSIFYDNISEKPPDNKDFVRITTLEGDSFQASFGSTRRFRDTGLVSVQIFTRKGYGENRARQIADNIASIFIGKTISGVVFESPSITRLGIIDGTWYQVNLTCPFYSDKFA